MMVKRFEAPLLRYATGIVGDSASAHDVVQDVFMRLHQAERARIEQHVAAWLYRVCRNRALEIRRKQKRRPPEPSGDRPETPADLTQRKEAVERALAAVESLPNAQREVLVLRFRDGLSYKEIASQTGRTVGTVGGLLHNALRRVRAGMEAADVAAR